MAWKQLGLQSAHLTYIILAGFLLFYALFSNFIKNRLHLAEPPIATFIGLIAGPKGLGIIDPNQWGPTDIITQELTRVIAGVQVFAIGVELPRAYLSRHWRSVAMLLGPVMFFSWLISALFAYLLFPIRMSTALIISACLSPTDPVLAAGIIGDSRFSQRVPKRIRDLLGAESASNDGVSFPFLFAGIYALTKDTAKEAAQEWFLITLLYECTFGLSLGLVLGITANYLLRLSQRSKFIESPSFLVFYLLLAVFAIGIGSTLGTDDFLVSFGAGIGFAWDGWFAHKTRDAHLPSILDLITNSSMFVYFGALMPWDSFSDPRIGVSPSNLILLCVLILSLRRIPAVLIFWKLIPDIKTWTEALFVGHFGPMGLGAVYLAITARAHLETGTSHPLPHPPASSKYEEAVLLVYPLVCGVVLSSIMVHGFSVLAIALVGHYSRRSGERSRLIGAEEDDLSGMVHDDCPSIASLSDPDE